MALQHGVIGVLASKSVTIGKYLAHFSFSYAHNSYRLPLLLHHGAAVAGREIGWTT
jgi:hypothetical protein